MFHSRNIKNINVLEKKSHPTHSMENEEAGRPCEKRREPPQLQQQKGSDSKKVETSNPVCC